MRLEEIQDLPDGTYHLSRVTGQVEDYAAKWAYGYIVGIKPMTRPPEYGELFGVWTDPLDGFIYVDIVTHVSDADNAVALARTHEQQAVYDLRDKVVRYIEDDSPKGWFRNE